MDFKFPTHQYVIAKGRLLANWPTLDSDTVADTLEGITDLHEMIGAMIRSAPAKTQKRRPKQNGLEMYGIMPYMNGTRRCNHATSRRT